MNTLLDELFGVENRPGARLDGPSHHMLSSDPVEWGKARVRQIAYINRYAPTGHPSVWDKTPVLEFLAYHDAVSSIIQRENKGPEESE